LVVVLEESKQKNVFSVYLLTTLTQVKVFLCVQRRRSANIWYMQAIAQDP